MLQDIAPARPKIKGGQKVLGPPAPSTKQKGDRALLLRVLDLPYDLVQTDLDLLMRPTPNAQLTQSCGMRRVHNKQDNPHAGPRDNTWTSHIAKRRTSTQVIEAIRENNVGDSRCRRLIVGTLARQCPTHAGP